MVDVAQLTEPVQRFFIRQRTSNEGEPAPRLPDGMKIRRRKDHQLAACTRLLGLVSSEDKYPLLQRPSARREWLTGPELLDAWTAEQDSTIQGHVAITRVDVNPTTALRWREVTGRHASELAGICRFFVRPRVRDQGVGSALLDTAVAECRARGLLPVAEVVSMSRQGVPLFDRAGWRLVEMYPCGKRKDGHEAYMYVAP